MPTIKTLPRPAVVVSSLSNRARRLAAVAGVISLALGAKVVAQEALRRDEQAGLGLRLELSSQTGLRPDVYQPGELMTLALAFTDAATGAPAQGLKLEGWLRPAEPTNLKCLEAGRAFRATRRLPSGSLDLNGVLFFAFHHDGSFAIIDPKLDLASANILAAGSLGEKPLRMVIENVTQSVLIFDKQKASVRRVRMDGEVEDLQSDVKGLVDFKPLLRGGYAILSQSGQLLERRDSKGRPVSRLATNTPLIGIAPHIGNILAAWSRDSVLLLDAQSTSVRKAIQLPEAVRDAVAWQQGLDGTPGVAALSADGKTVYIGYEDQAAGPQKIQLAIPAERLAYEHTQHKLLAWNAQGGVTIVDIARGEFASAVSVHKGIAGIAFTGNAAFMLSLDASSVAVLELASARAGLAPQMREVRIGPKGANVGPGDGLVKSLAPSPQALVVHPGTNTGFVIDERSAIGDAPPMSAVALRGGRIFALQVIDRSIRETGPGQFETRFIVPKPGDYELVISTGIGGLTQCLPLQVQGATEVKAEISRGFRLQLNATTLRSGVAGTVQFRIVNKEGEPVKLADPSIEMASLEFGWRPEIHPRHAASGEVSFEVSLPFPGLYGLSVHDASWGDSPAVNEVLEVLP